MEPSDGLPFLGRNPHDHDNVYIITGDSGNGMSHCTVGATLIHDLILGRHNDWADLYAPTRKAFHGMGDFITEQANTLAQYSDWLRGGEVESVDEIGAGEGAVLRNGGKLLAVYRSDDGGLHPPGLRGALERGRKVVGLPVPRFALCRRRRGAARAGAPAAVGRHPRNGGRGARARRPNRRAAHLTNCRKTRQVRLKNGQLRFWCILCPL
jgi:hypothetical protein